MTDDNDDDDAEAALGVREVVPAVVDVMILPLLCVDHPFIINCGAPDHLSCPIRDYI